jgi:hypothetical protein
MRQARQIELLKRVAASGDQLRGLQIGRSASNSASAYTDPMRFEQEITALFKPGPLFFGLSADLPEPGS